jgi:hypothetical protein
LGLITLCAFWGVAGFVLKTIIGFYSSMKNFETVVVRGIATFNFELLLDSDTFVSVCSELDLNAEDYRTFTEEQWLKVRKNLKDTTADYEENIVVVDLYDTSRISVDEVTLQNDLMDISVVTYEIGDKVHSIELDV